MEIPTQEYWRKAIHFSGLFFILILLWNRGVFTGMLILFLIAYLGVEFLAKKEKRIPILSTLAAKSKREEESGKVSKGAVCLVLAALVTPYLFGPWAAAVGLSQTFSADAVSSLAGIKWGSKKLPYSPKKSWVGSLAYFCTAFAAALFFVHPVEAAGLALLGTVVESLPFPEIDNLTVPLAVGLAAKFWP